MTTIKQQFAKREFINRLNEMTPNKLKELYEKMKMDTSIPFSTLGIISKIYNEKTRVR